MAYNGLAKHAQGKVFIDQLFGASAVAKEAVKKYGKDNVIDGTIGVLCDEEGKFVFFPTVEKIFRNLPSEEIAAYASVRGTPEYLSAAEGLTFGTSRPDAYVEAVATSGGAGAVCNVIWNYSNFGDAVLTHDWYWQPYQVLCSDVLRRLETFSFYDTEYKFNIVDFESKVRNLLSNQESLIVILNSPNNNPTGYSLSDEEWDQVLDVFKQQVAQKDKTIVLLVDIAYIEFMGDPERGRRFMKKFGGLPENILVTFAFSASKTFTMYGQRTGALIGVSSSKNVIDEFVNATKITGRTRWSTISHAGMSLVPTVYHDSELRAQVAAERTSCMDLIGKRAGIFVEEAKQVGLQMLPYCGGFFVGVPTPASEAASEKLREQNIFIAALEQGIRIAVCSLPVRQVQGLAAKVADAVKSV